MEGKICIEVSNKNEMTCECALRDVNNRDRGLLLHTVAELLNMNETDIRMFVLAESIGFFKDATEVTGAGRNREEAEADALRRKSELSVTDDKED